MLERVRKARKIMKNVKKNYEKGIEIYIFL